MLLDGIEYTHELTNKPYRTVKNRVGGMCIDINHINHFVNTISNSTCNNYLEIGTFDGIALSIYAERFPDKTFTAVDSFSVGHATGGGHFEYFIQNNKEFENTRLYKGKSIEVLPKLITMGNKYDFIFIDGDHSYEVVSFDLECATKLINPGGIIAMHDIDNEQIKKVINEAKTKYNFISSSVHPCGVQEYVIGDK